MNKEHSITACEDALRKKSLYEEEKIGKNPYRNKLDMIISEMKGKTLSII